LITKENRMWLKGDNKISTLFRGRRRLENIEIFSRGNKESWR
jgi:hypothetical protein